MASTCRDMSTWIKPSNPRDALKSWRAEPRSCQELSETHPTPLEQWIMDILDILMPTVVPRLSSCKDVRQTAGFEHLSQVFQSLYIYFDHFLWLQTCATWTSSGRDWHFQRRLTSSRFRLCWSRRALNTLTFLCMSCFFMSEHGTEEGYENKVLERKH